MAIPTTAAVASRSPWNNVRPHQGTAVTLTTNVTNTATTATQVTGLTNTFVVKPNTTNLMFFLQADNFTNSSTNNVIITLWDGVVGTGTQIGQYTLGQQSAAPNEASLMFFIPIAGSLWNTSKTYNIGMHGSGAGTNTLVCGTTNPCNFWTFAF